MNRRWLFPLVVSVVTNWVVMKKKKKKNWFNLVISTSFSLSSICGNSYWKHGWLMSGRVWCWEKPPSDSAWCCSITCSETCFRGICSMCVIWLLRCSEIFFKRSLDSKTLKLNLHKMKRCFKAVIVWLLMLIFSWLSDFGGTTFKRSSVSQTLRLLPPLTIIAQNLCQTDQSLQNLHDIITTLNVFCQFCSDASFATVSLTC